MFAWNVFRQNLIDEGIITPEQMRAMQKRMLYNEKEDLSW